MKSTTLQPYWRTISITITGFILGILSCIPVMLLFGTEKKDFNQPLPSLLGYTVVHLTMLFYAQASLKTKATIIKTKAYSFINLFAMFFIFFIVMDVLIYWIKLPSISGSIFENEFKQSPGLFFTSMVFIAPILEELIFRGVMLSYVLKHKSDWTAILFSALLFGLVHVSPDQVVWSFLGGIFLGYAYLKSKNILVPILFHSLNNFLYYIYLCNDISSWLDLIND